MREIRKERVREKAVGVFLQRITARMSCNPPARKQAGADRRLPGPVVLLLFSVLSFAASLLSGCRDQMGAGARAAGRASGSISYESTAIVFSLFWVVVSAALLLFLLRKQVRLRKGAQADVETLKVQEELYKLALAHGRRHVLRLDIKNHILRAEDSDFFNAAAGTVWEDLPESLLESDMIAPESKGQIRRLYQDILDGQGSGEMTLMARSNDGRYTPHHVKYTTLLDEENVPSFAILTYEDVSAARDKELAYKRWRSMLDKMPSRKYRLIEHNLSRNTVDNAEGELFDAGRVKYMMEYNEKMDHFVKELVHPEDAALFVPIMDREQLLRDYDNEKRTMELDFRLLEKGHDPRWVRLSMQMIEYPDTTDIKCYKMYEDIDAQKRKELALKLGSEQDSLTRVYNRGTFEETVNRMLESKQEDARYALILIDVDDLKSINDRFGHAAGDNSLIMIADILRTVFRQDDVIGRLGGDEFAVLMQDVPGDYVVSRRIRQVNTALRNAGDGTGIATCSMGVSMHPKDGMTFAQLYRRADLALYRAKKFGKGDFFFFSDHDERQEDLSVDSHGNTEDRQVTFDRCYLFRNEDEWRYRGILESTRTIVIEFDVDRYEYVYDINVSRYLAGTYDSRPLGQIFSQDRVADATTRKRIQAMIEHVAAGSDPAITTREVLLRTRDGDKRWFRMRVVKMDDIYMKTRKVLIVLNDAHEEILTLEQLRRLADYDDLTDLHNKSAFLRLAGERIHRAEPGTYAVVALDVDRFRNVNELFGFEGGNRLLRHIAQVLQELAGSDCIPARLSGDRFVLLTLNDRESIRKHLIPECLRRIDEYRPKMDVVINFGIYEAVDREMDVITMIDHAQAAEDKVKGGYTSRYAFYDGHLRRKEQKEREIVSRMRQALEDEEFAVYLQPQYEHPSGRLRGAEALVRWNHPARGLIMPREFVPLFEENGFIAELDRYVWAKACKLLHRWKDMGLATVPVSVNFSRVDLFDPQLRETLLRIMRKEKVRPDMLGIEVTESAFIEDSAHISEILQKMRRAGFTLFMDDFGTGYSSLNILKDIPVDVLKLDMRFLSLPRKNNDKARSILRSVIRMSGDLSVSVIAEGVETKEQADELAEMGCHVVQGYWYSPPIPADEYEVLLIEMNRKGNL